MGLHVVALAKLKLGSQSLRPAMVGAIACPLVLMKLVMGLRLFRDEAVYATRLFFFRLGQIAFNTEPPFADGTRLERAFRLLCQIVASSATTVTTTSTSPFDEDSEIGQDTIRTLSMLTL